MQKIFISGSISIKKLDRNVLDRIDEIIKAGHQIIVGDADGVDRLAQCYLHEQDIGNVVVYCSGDISRNNIGNWNVMKVHTDKSPGSRVFFAAKDLQMADDCERGLMVWDSESTGTLSNTIELLKRDKASLVYIDRAKTFLEIKQVRHLEELLSHMSESALAKAEAKLRLNKVLASLRDDEQPSLF